MTDDFPALRNELRQGYRDLMKAIPDQMKGFGDLHRAAVADGALPQTTKELMAVAIAICTQCDDCITLHMHDALRAGATAGDGARDHRGGTPDGWRPRIDLRNPRPSSPRAVQR